MPARSTASASVKSKTTEIAADSMPPPAKKAKKARCEIGKPVTPKQAHLCEICTARPKTRSFPDGKDWNEFSKLGDQSIPVGPLCLNCGDIWRDQFPNFSTTDEFITHAKSPKGKTEIIEIQRVKAGGKKAIADEKVYVALERGIRIARPYIFLLAQSTCSTSSAQHQLESDGLR